MLLNNVMADALRMWDAQVHYLLHPKKLCEFQSFEVHLELFPCSKFTKKPQKLTILEYEL